MATLLIHKAMDGEPIGVLNDAGESYYTPAFAARETYGRSVVGDKGYAVPWSVFVERKASTVNFRDWWEVLNTSEDLQAALETRRDEFFSQQSSETNTDL